jgi:hypothetical protein
MRTQKVEDWSDVPSKEEITRAHAASFHLKSMEQIRQSIGAIKQLQGMGKQLIQITGGRVSGTPDMSETQRNSNYSKWELLQVRILRSDKSHCPSDSENLTDYECKMLSQFAYSHF